MHHKTGLPAIIHGLSLHRTVYDVCPNQRDVFYCTFFPIFSLLDCSAVFLICCCVVVSDILLCCAGVWLFVRGVLKSYWLVPEPVFNATNLVLV